VRKKIIGMSVLIALIAILCAQSVAAQVSDVTVNIWTDKAQYKPGEKGTLKISILNERDEPIEIKNITIEYPWFAYDADKGEWVGNETIKLDPAEILASEGGHYYREVEFTVPADGRVTGYPFGGGSVDITIGTSEGPIQETPYLMISSVSLLMSLTGLDTWMTSLLVAVVVCTIILAIVIFLATRGTRASEIIAPPPPPKPKAKAE